MNYLNNKLRFLYAGNNGIKSTILEISLLTLICKRKLDYVDSVQLVNKSNNKAIKEPSIFITLILK